MLGSNFPGVNPNQRWTGVWIHTPPSLPSGERTQLSSGFCTVFLSPQRYGRPLACSSDLLVDACWILSSLPQFPIHLWCFLGTFPMQMKCTQVSVSTVFLGPPTCTFYPVKGFLTFAISLEYCFSMAGTVGVFNLTGMRLVTTDDLVQTDLLPPKISILLESLSDYQIKGENSENATFISPLVFTWLNLSCSLHRSLCR